MIIPISELKNSTGYHLPTLKYNIDSTLVSRFCAAIGDDSPRWHKEAPPSLIPTLGFDKVFEMLDSGPQVTVLHGSTEYEMYKPVYLGDTIAVQATLASARERVSQGKTSVFTSFDILYLNHKEEMVARCKQLAIVTQ